LADQPDEVHSLADTIVHWCRETLASSRRPYGVDHFDLSIAFGAAGSVRNLTFNRLRVQHLYEEALPRELVDELGKVAQVAGATVVHVAAGLFSWGDAMHQALGAEPAARVSDA
jgi:hypothetical protein